MQGHTAWLLTWCEQTEADPVTLFDEQAREVLLDDG